MEAPARSSRRVRTGLFEIDLGAGDVRKRGRKVPLQEQPFRVLASIDEPRSCPWGKDGHEDPLRASGVSCTGNEPSTVRREVNRP
jgi:hypothetical protein